MSHTTSDSDSEKDREEEMLCPLCLEELDITDRNFRPCQCGYQMCRFCWHHVKENLNGKCPACRKPYDPENYSFIPPDPEEIAKMVSQKKQKERKKKKEKGGIDTSKTSDIIASRKNLSNVRVIQRNLVYVTNLALSFAKEEILRKNEYFGQYGKIQKVVINKNNLYNVSSPGGPSVSAYVTYYKSQDALSAIRAVDGSWLGGRTLRASFGTTKYCTYFLKDVPCTNPDCMYLHELGGDTDSFTKEEMAVGKSTFHHQIHPVTNRPQKLLTTSKGQSVLPPPGIVEDSEMIDSEPAVLDGTPPNGILSPPVMVEGDGDQEKATKPAPTQPKSAWKSIAATTPPKSSDLLSNWPKPAAAVAMPRTASPTTVPPKVASQERASALPPTASWAQKVKKSNGGEYVSPGSPPNAPTLLYGEPIEPNVPVTDAPDGHSEASDTKPKRTEPVPVPTKKASSTPAHSEGDSTSETPVTAVKQGKSPRAKQAQKLPAQKVAPPPEKAVPLPKHEKAQPPTQTPPTQPPVAPSTVTQAPSQPPIHTQATNSPAAALAQTAKVATAPPKSQAQPPQPSKTQPTSAQPISAQPVASSAKAVPKGTAPARTQVQPQATQNRTQPGKPAPQGKQPAVPAKATQAQPATTVTSRTKPQPQVQPTRHTQDAPEKAKQSGNAQTKVVAEVKREPRDWSDVVSPRSQVAAQDMAKPKANGAKPGAQPQMQAQVQASRNVAAGEGSPAEDHCSTNGLTEFPLVNEDNLDVHADKRTTDDTEGDDEEEEIYSDRSSDGGAGTEDHGHPDMLWQSEENEDSDEHPEDDTQSHSVSSAWDIPSPTSPLHTVQRHQQQPSHRRQPLQQQQQKRNSGGNSSSSDSDDALVEPSQAPWEIHAGEPGGPPGGAVSSGASSWGSPVASPKRDPPDGLDFDPWSELRLADLLVAEDDTARGHHRKFNQRRKNADGDNAHVDPTTGREEDGNSDTTGLPGADRPAGSMKAGATAGGSFASLSWAAAVEGGMPRAAKGLTLPPPGLSGRAKSRFGFAQDPDGDQSSPPSEYRDAHGYEPAGHRRGNPSSSSANPPFVGHPSQPPSLRSAHQEQPYQDPAEISISQRGNVSMDLEMAPADIRPPLVVQQHAEMQQTLRALLPNVNISFTHSPSHQELAQDGWDTTFTKQSISPIFNPSSPWGPPSIHQKSPQAPAWGPPHLAQQPTNSIEEALPYQKPSNMGQPGRQPSPVTAPNPIGGTLQRQPQTSMPTQPQRPAQNHLPLPIPQGHHLFAQPQPAQGNLPHRSQRGNPAAPNPALAPRMGFDDPWRGTPPMMQPDGKAKGPAAQGKPPVRPQGGQGQAQGLGHHSHGGKLLGTFQDPAIMMMASQGMPYAGNPWGLDPSYGAAYSMPTGLPPGLVMPLMSPQAGAAPPPGFFGGAAMVNAYARPPAPQPKSKYLPAQTADSAAKRPPNRRKNNGQ